MLEFTLAVILLELTPGPNMAYLATVALSRGRRAGLVVTAGIAAGLSLHALAAAVGLGALVQHQPALYELLRWAGVIFLVWLAIEGWTQTVENSPARISSRSPHINLFWRGFWSNAFNPKSILFFVTIVPRFVPSAENSHAVRLALLGSIYVTVATAIHATIVVASATLQPWLLSGRRSIVTRRILSVMLLGVALWLAWNTAR